jgi:hypothetical protein
MPTIDQLAPATAASDNDELLVSQSGIVRKVTRAQVLAGVQPQLAVTSGSLLGRVSGGIGGPEQIRLGANLTLSNGALSASDASFDISSLPAGTVPASVDLVPVGQGGSNTAVTYAQFMSGLAGISNIDGSQLLVTPTGKQTPAKLADFAASTLTLAGGTLTGALTLATDPAGSLQAATKKYVDGQIATTLPRTGGSLSGALTLAADPTTSLQAATKQYVDGQVDTAVPRTGGTLTGALTLAADPANSLQAATKQYVDSRVSRSGDTLTGPLVLAGDPVASRDKGICRCAALQRPAQDWRHALRRTDSGGRSQLIDAGRHQTLRRRAGRRIAANQRWHPDRPALTAIKSCLASASGTEAIRR